MVSVLWFLFTRPSSEMWDSRKFKSLEILIPLFNSTMRRATLIFRNLIAINVLTSTTGVGFTVPLFMEVKWKYAYMHFLIFYNFLSFNIEQCLNIHFFKTITERPNILAFQKYLPGSVQFIFLRFLETLLSYKQSFEKCCANILL